MLAPAKINLYLHVTGKRDDGYHLLDSLMTSVDVCDEIEVISDDNLSLEVINNYDSGFQKDLFKANIALKAAELLASDAGLANYGAKIKLIKNIPIAAGMGGGSADAAATLRLLNGHWGIGASEDELIRIGLKIGADVPFCIKNKPAFISGVGEIIEYLENPLPHMHILLVNPKVNLSTPEVFKARGFDFKSNRQGEKFPYDFDGLIEHLSSKGNDLEKNAISLVPEIKNVLDFLSEQDGCELARMSGSGATCFGIFREHGKMEEAVKNIQINKSNWWVRGVTNA